MGKLVIFSAPSGSGKTTIVRSLLERFPELEFSISATSRSPRGKEKHGIDYYFFTPDEFQEKVKNNEFIEWEEVYQGTYYGTLSSEVKRLWNLDKTVLFDIDVVGGVNLKNLFPKESVSFFIQAPSLQILENRLRGRGTDTEEKIIERLEKAEYELSFAPKFDHVIINDQLDQAVKQVEAILKEFLEK